MPFAASRRPRNSTTLGRCATSGTSSATGGGTRATAALRAMLGEERAEFARRPAGERDLLRERALAVRGDIGDRPALEELVRAIGVDRGGDAAVRLGCGTQHRDA